MTLAPANKKVFAIAGLDVEAIGSKMSYASKYLQNVLILSPQ
jgi:hypothetical protein